MLDAKASYLLSRCIRHYRFLWRVWFIHGRWGT